MLRVRASVVRPLLLCVQARPVPWCGRWHFDDEDDDAMERRSLATNLSECSDPEAWFERAYDGTSTQRESSGESDRGAPLVSQHCHSSVSQSTSAVFRSLVSIATQLFPSLLLLCIHLMVRTNRLQNQCQAQLPA